MQLAPQVFSAQMSADLELPRSFVQPIASSISRQIKRAEFERAHSQWNSKAPAVPFVDSLCCIDVDLRFRSIVYRDHFHWDVNCLNSSPERFARITVADLALPQVRVLQSRQAILERD